MRERASSSHQLWVSHLGTVPYREALALQLRVRERRLAGELPDTLLLLEHPPVYTRGRRSGPGELTLGEDFYRARGIEVVETDRGGRVTYHGPGQLVGYPIMRVADVGAHLRTIEAAIAATLADYGVQARSRRHEGPDYTGVWVDDRKIASIGVHVSRGISTHGFAINATTDLDPFSWIVACGLPNVTMTSLARELVPDNAPDMDRLRTDLLDRFCALHSREPRTVSPRQLGLDAPPTDAARTRGRTPLAHAHRTGVARADADRPLIGRPRPTPDAATVVTDHGAPV